MKGKFIPWEEARPQSRPLRKQGRTGIGTESPLRRTIPVDGKTVRVGWMYPQMLCCLEMIRLVDSERTRCERKLNGDPQQTRPYILSLHARMRTIFSHLSENISEFLQSS